MDSKHICRFGYVLDLFEEEKQRIHKLKSCYVLTHSSSGFSNTNCHRQTTIKLYEVKVFPLPANTGINSTPNTQQVEAKYTVAVQTGPSAGVSLCIIFCRVCFSTVSEYYYQNQQCNTRGVYFQYQQCITRINFTTPPI